MDNPDSDEVDALAEKYASGELTAAEFEAALAALDDDDEADDEEETPDYTPGQLMAMAEDEARETLPDHEFDRWQKLAELDAEAEETKQQWADERERVTDLVVHADPDELGTEVSIYGNDLLVRIDSENEDFRQAAQSLESEFATDDREVDELADEDADTIAGYLMDMLDAILLRWNGTDWPNLPDHERETILHQARDKWGVDGLLTAWTDIAAAVQRDRQEQVEAVDGFR